MARRRRKSRSNPRRSRRAKTRAKKIKRTGRVRRGRYGVIYNKRRARRLKRGASYGSYRMRSNPAKMTIRKNDYGEYVVRVKDGKKMLAEYFGDSKEDAIGTSNLMLKEFQGQGVEVIDGRTSKIRKDPIRAWYENPGRALRLKGVFKRKSDKAAKDFNEGKITQAQFFRILEAEEDNLIRSHGVTPDPRDLKRRSNPGSRKNRLTTQQARDMGYKAAKNGRSQGWPTRQDLESTPRSRLIDAWMDGYLEGEREKILSSNAIY